MKNFINSVKLSGYLYDHKLQERVTGEASKTPGTKYITGTITIATDDELTNTVDVFYRFVTETNKDGKANRNYSELQKIVNGTYETVMGAGAENATMLSISRSAIALNDFYKSDGNDDTLVSVKRNEGGWISKLTSLPTNPDERNLFDIDMIVVGIRHEEANEEFYRPEKVILKGYSFNWKRIVPLELSVTNERAMDYFMGLEASTKHPYCTHLKGREISETIIRTRIEPGAFEDFVREVPTSRKDFVVHWAASEAYPYDDESFITEAEMAEAMEARTVMLAEEKARYINSKNNRGSAIPAAAPAKAAPKKSALDDFDF